MRRPRQEDDSSKQDGADNNDSSTNNNKKNVEDAVSFLPKQHHQQNSNNNNNKNKFNNNNKFKNKNNSNNKFNPTINPDEVKNLQEKALDLPVSKTRAAIVKMVRSHPVCIFVGETGSGKTTQIPQFIFDDIFKKDPLKQDLMIGISQPRRVAATSVAGYVARCRGENLAGAVEKDKPPVGEVGYCVRFDEKVSSSTRLKFMTDGMLLRELLVDDALTKYSCIILDEAHERTLNGDVLFGLLKQLIKTRRKDLKIIVMSATLDTDAFSAFWNNAPIGFISGRTFPVTTFFTDEPQADYVDAAINTIIQIHLSEVVPSAPSGVDGDILCFLTGMDEIEDAKSILLERRRFLPNTAPDFKVVTLYANMSPTQQMEAFRPAPRGVRKIVLATNIAETSITIEGVVYVIDTGVVKARQYIAETGLETLQVVPGSQAQARQRSGRAGRMRPGKCYRLFTEDAYYRLEDQTTPEILRCNLSSVVLQMKKMGINDVLGFDFMDRPSTLMLLKALEELSTLGAINDETGEITSLGLDLVKFPVEPMEARCILKGIELGVSDEICVILAMMSVNESGLFENSSSSSNSNNNNNNSNHRHTADANRAQFTKMLGDHLTFLSVYEGYATAGRNLGGFSAATHLQHKNQSEGGDETTAKKGPPSNFQQAQQLWCQSNGINAKQMKKAVEIEVQLRNHCEKIRHEFKFGGKNKDNNSKTNTNILSSASKNNNNHQSPMILGPYRPSNHLRQEAASEYQNIRRCFVSGFFMHTAFFDAKIRNYRTSVGKEVVHIHPKSVVHEQKRKPPLLLFHSVVQTQKPYMRECLAIREDWLFDEAPNVFPRGVSSAV